MPAKTINTRKNYKLLGGTKMRGGSNEFLEEYDLAKQNYENKEKKIYDPLYEKWKSLEDPDSNRPYISTKIEDVDVENYKNGIEQIIRALFKLIEEAKKEVEQKHVKDLESIKDDLIPELAKAWGSDLQNVETEDLGKYVDLLSKIRFKILAIDTWVLENIITKQVGFGRRVRKSRKKGGYNSKKMRGGTNNDNDYQGFLVVDIEEACKEWYKLTQFYEIPDTGDAIDIEEKIKHNEKVRLIVNKIKKLGSVEAPEMADLKDSLLGIEGVTEEKIQEKLTALQNRLKKKENDLYKVQTFGELLEYQSRFCPAGFHNNLKNFIQEHENSFLLPKGENNLSSEYSKLKAQGKIIFSNEALSDSFLKDEQKAEYKLQDVGNEYFSVFHSNGFTGTEDGTHWYVEDKTEDKTKKYYTAHYSSLAEREGASNIWCNNLSKLLGELKSDGNFGGFAGDINLYVTRETDGTLFQLRDGVDKALNDYNCSLTIPFNLLNKDAFRNEINDQWHKVGKSALKKETKGTQEVAKPTLDSLVIIEPYVYKDKFDYQKLANEYQQVIFLPNGKGTVMPDGNGVSKEKKPFKWEDRTVTDHFLVVGRKLAIYSGADIHGIGNKAKKTTHYEGKNMTLYEGNEKLLEIINKCIKLVKSLTPGNVELLASRFNQMTGGARRVKKSRKKGGRRGKKSKRVSRRN